MRLKVLIKIPISDNPLTFLFQIGAIKSQGASADENVLDRFLFQIGAIKSVPQELLGDYQKPFRFLFQIGAIKRKYERRGTRTVSIVSIPNWCD